MFETFFFGVPVDIGDPQTIFGEPQKFAKGEVPKEQLSFVVVLNSI